MVFKKIRETIYRSLQNKNNIYLSFLASDPPASRATKSRRKGREDILTVFCPFSFLVGKTGGEGRTQWQVLDLPEPFIPGEISKTRSDDAVEL